MSSGVRAQAAVALMACIVWAPAVRSGIATLALIEGPADLTAFAIVSESAVLGFLGQILELCVCKLKQPSAASTSPRPCSAPAALAIG